jgi:hypothetical protein
MERADIAWVHAAVLQARLLHLTVRVNPRGEMDGFRVILDHVPLMPAQWGTAIPEDPGDHELLATATGFRPWRVTFKVAAGTEPTITVPPLEPDPTSGDVAAMRPGPSPSPWIDGVLGTGVAGIASLAVGTGFGIAALVNKSAADTPDGRCAASGCDSIGYDEHRRAHDDAIVADCTLAAGGAVVLGSAVAYVFLRRAQGRGSARVTAGVAPSVGGASIVVGGGF